jgi:putative ABC transport system ATP-binding protein
MKKIVELKKATVQVNNGFDEVKTILDDVNLDIYEHDFLTILGGNGAGKSTLFNVIAGTLMLTSGTISILGEEDVTHLPAEKRAKYLARVFQDPKMGTATPHDSGGEPAHCQGPRAEASFFTPPYPGPQG